MNFEMPSVQSPEQPLDQKWYDRYHESGSFEAFDYLIGDKDYRSLEKQKFLQGDIEYPHLDYPKLKEFDFDIKEERLLKLKKDVLELERNNVVKKVYQWKINEKIAELRMLRAASNNDDYRFAKYSRFIYGSPETNVDIYTMNSVRDQMTAIIASNESSLVQMKAAKSVVQNLPAAKKQEEIEQINVDRSPLSQSNSEKFTAQEIKKKFEGALTDYGLDNWSVITGDDFTSISVGQELREIRIPSDRVLNKVQLQQLIAHEIGTHARRRNNGERSKLKILGLGLDRYEKGEEGVATYEEQRISPAEDYAGLIGYISISLASNKQSSFRDVFDILKDYHIANGKAEKIAENLSWSHCVRAFRGTTCEGAGNCFTKDLVYRNGNIDVWHLINNNSDEQRRFMVGKYDPANPRHIWVLDQLEITEEELEGLEKETLT